MKIGSYTIPAAIVEAAENLIIERARLASWLPSNTTPRLKTGAKCLKSPGHTIQGSSWKHRAYIPYAAGYAKKNPKP